MRALNKKTQRGFILIELLVALLLIATSFSMAIQYLFTAQRLQYQLYEQLKTNLATPNHQISRPQSTLKKGR